MKTFCGILLCCLDASAIIKGNGTEFQDFSWIVKYAHFLFSLFMYLCTYVYISMYYIDTRMLAYVVTICA